jgi:hypothetical protein
MTTKENANTGSVIGTISENSFHIIIGTIPTMLLKQNILNHKIDLFEIGIVCGGVVLCTALTTLSRVGLNKAKPKGRELYSRYACLLRTRYGKKEALLRAGSEQSIDIAEKEAAL